MARTERTYDVITLGDMCVDLIVSGGDIVPRFGQVEQLVSDYTVEMGGSTCIFACQAARLGLRVGILGKVGADWFGNLILERLSGCGVDIQHVSVDSSLKTGIGVALCKDGDRAILTYPGSLNALTPEEVPDAFLRTARHLHHGSYFLLDRLQPAVPALFRHAQELALTTSLDTNWDPAERWDGGLRTALRHTDLFMPNLQELLRITRTSSLADGLRAIKSLGVGIAAVKLGERGACVSDGKRFYSCRVSPVTGGDSIGAGDSFDAGFLSGWLADATLGDALRMGCGCGRATSRAAGGLAGQPDRTSLHAEIADLAVTTEWLS